VGATPSLSPCATMACSGTALLFFTVSTVERSSLQYDGEVGRMDKFGGETLSENKLEDLGGDGMGS
jgi:hypothetical protein